MSKERKMTDTELNIAIAERKGWREIRDVFGALQGFDPNGKPGYVPAYTSDPREYMPLLDEIARDKSVCDVELVAICDDGTDAIEYVVRVSRWKQYAQLPSFYAAEPGRAVAEAWLACNNLDS